MNDWKLLHEKIFPNRQHNIPAGLQLSIGKLSDYCMVTTDTCNSAQKLNRLLCKKIELKVLADGIKLTNKEVKVCSQWCHNHLQNIWIGATNKALSKYLNELLGEDLEHLDSKPRITTNFDAVLFAIDKCFSMWCNYSKGSGAEFQAWMKKYHPGSLLVPVTRASGSRQDLTVEGAPAVYWNRHYYLEFLKQSLDTVDNILHTNLYVTLKCSEMIAMTRVFSILHFSVVSPMQYLAGSSHLLGEYNWSSRRMGQAIDILESKLIEILNNGNKFLNRDFMTSLLKVLSDEIKPLREYMEHLTKKKLSATLLAYNTPKLEYYASRVAVNAEIIDKLFNPKQASNMETNDLTIDMAMLAANCILKELRDPKKATSDYLSSVDRNFSWANTTEETHKNLIGTFATNDLAESPFASLTYQLDSFNMILGNNAAAVAQARMNGDFNRREFGYKNDGEFHTLSDEMKR